MTLVLTSLCHLGISSIMTPRMCRHLICFEASVMTVRKLLKIFNPFLNLVLAFLNWSKSSAEVAQLVSFQLVGKCKKVYHSISVEAVLVICRTNPFSNKIQ